MDINTLATLAIIGGFICLLWAVYTTYKTSKANKARILAEARFEHYKSLADEAIDQADARLKSMETTFKEKLDEIRRQADLKLGALGKEVTDIVADIRLNKTAKIQAITAIKVAVDNEINSGYQL